MQVLKGKHRAGRVRSRVGIVPLVMAMLLMALLLGSCSSRKQTAAHRLLIYTPHGPDLLGHFVARYKEKYPECDIQVLDIGSRQILERVRAERNRPQADLWWGAAHMTFQTAADDNLLAVYHPTWADKVPAAARDQQDRWYGTYETPEVIVYNSDGVSAADAPRDWDDVLDPKWHDKILIRNPIPSDTMRVIFGAMIWRSFKDTGSPEKGYDWLQRLDTNVHEYAADGTFMMQKLTRREGLISLWDMPDAELFKEQKGLPIAYTIPSSGTPVVTDGIAIIRGAPHEDEARRFYEFVTTTESLVQAAQKFARMPVRTDIDRKQLPAWMNTPFTRMPLDWDVLRKQGDEWLRYWDTEIRGRGSR